MLYFTNAEGSKFNPAIDNYLVVKVTDFANTKVSELQQLLKLIESSHDEMVMIEADGHGQDLIMFLENIGKLCVFKAKKCGNQYYSSVQKTLI